MALFPRWSELRSIRTVTDALTFFYVSDEVWQAFLNQVGDCREDLRLVAALSRPAGAGVAVMPDGGGFSPPQATQVGLVWRLGRRVMAFHGGVSEDAFVDVEVWLDNPIEESQSSTRLTSSAPAGGGGSVKEKVLKPNETNAELNKWHQTYVAIMAHNRMRQKNPHQINWQPYTKGCLSMITLRTAISGCGCLLRER